MMTLILVAKAPQVAVRGHATPIDVGRVNTVWNEERAQFSHSGVVTDLPGSWTSLLIVACPG